MHRGEAVRALAGLLMIANLACAGMARAQDYPAKPIVSICNFAAGSGADILVRFYSDRLSKLAGQPVLVENRVGAQGNIATEAAVRSKPDGYTIMITPASSTLAAAPHVFKKLTYDPLKDFTPITTVARLSFAIAVDANKPFQTMADLVEHLRKKPENGAYGSGANSGIVSSELVKEIAGLKTTFIPYKVSGQALNELIAGQTDFIAYDTTFLSSQARSGRIRLLAMTSGKRQSAFPNVPTLAESGFPGVDITPWWGVVVPAGTPQPIVERLAGWFNQITSSDETRDFLAKVATEPFPGNQQMMTELLRKETADWARYVKLARIEPQ